MFALLIALNLLWSFSGAPVASSAPSCGPAVYTRGEDYQLGSPVRTITEMILHGRLSSAFFYTAKGVGSYAASGWPMKWPLCLELLGLQLLLIRCDGEASKLQTATECKCEDFVLFPSSCKVSDWPFW